MEEVRLGRLDRVEHHPVLPPCAQGVDCKHLRRESAHRERAGGVCVRTARKTSPMMAAAM